MFQITNYPGNLCVVIAILLAGDWNAGKHKTEIQPTSLVHLACYQAAMHTCLQHLPGLLGEVGGNQEGRE